MEYEFPWGYKEMFGCAYRTDFDLTNHANASGQALVYTYPDGKKVVPHVIEPTFGLSRLITIILMDAYREQELENGETRVYLDLDPKIAPVNYAVFPLIKKPELQELARKIQAALVARGYYVEYDEAGTVGKRYRKQDEIGTPKCITVDFDSLEDGCVTIRDRNTTEQVRVKIEEL